MQSFCEITLQLDEFLKQEWPFSESYFGILAVNNSGIVGRIRRGSAEFGTVKRALSFVDRYRDDPEGTMEQARANLPTAQKKKPARRARARKGQSRSSRVAA